MSNHEEHNSTLFTLKEYEEEMSYWFERDYSSRYDHALENEMINMMNTLVNNMLMVYYQNGYTTTEYKKVDPSLCELKCHTDEYPTDEYDKYFDLPDAKYIVYNPKNKYQVCKLVSGRYHFKPNNGITAYYLTPDKLDQYDINYIYLCLTANNKIDNEYKSSYENMKEIPYVELQIQQSIVKKYNEIREQYDRIFDDI